MHQSGALCVCVVFVCVYIGGVVPPDLVSNLSVDRFTGLRLSRTRLRAAERAVLSPRGRHWLHENNFTYLFRPA